MKMSRHVMECLGKSRVVIEDGKVISVSEPMIRRCPLMEKYRGIEHIDEDSIRENIEYRIGAFGMCTEKRDVRMKDFLSFGISETLSTALKEGLIDAVVLAADGCGTCVVTDPEIVQGLGGRISGIRETEPIPVVVDAVGAENMLDSETAAIDMVAGAEKAFAMGYQQIAVTSASVRDVETIKKRYGEKAIVAMVHTTGSTEEDARIAFDNSDIITACASRPMREEAARRPDVLIAGKAVPIYGVTEKGKLLIMKRLELVGKKPWDPSQGPQTPPEPLV